MEKVMFVQKVKKEKVNEYIDYHRKAWPDLLCAMKECGIEEEIIWLYGDLVLIYVRAEDFNKSMAELAKREIFQRWLAVMRNLLAEMQDYSESGRITKLEKIFDLNDQLCRR